MIRYALNCDQHHQFESWFQSSEAFDRLLAAGLIGCGICGSPRVEKLLMAPAVRLTPAARPARAVPAPIQSHSAAETPAGPLSGAANPVELALAAMRKQVEENSEYVGLNFAAEARAIHDGDRPERAIYGEARPEDARRLIEDGVPVAPLPFLPSRKAN